MKLFIVCCEFRDRFTKNMDTSATCIRRRENEHFVADKIIDYLSSRPLEFPVNTTGNMFNI